MKIKLLALALFAASFALGCGATTRESTEAEREAGIKKMDADMKSMQMNLPQNPGQGQQPAGGGTTTTP
jgi:hypothetical protein